MEAWRDAISFLRDEFSSYLLLAVLCGFPLQCLFGVIQVSGNLMELWTGWGISVFFSLYLMITAISQLPCVCQVEHAIRYGTVKFQSILEQCLEQFPRYCLAVLLYAGVVVLAFRLFWLIGVFLFFSFSLLPFSVVFEKKSIFAGWAVSWNMGMKHLGKVMIVFSLWCAVILLCDGLIWFAVGSMKGNIVLYLVVQAFVHALLHSLFFVYLSFAYWEWRECE